VSTCDESSVNGNSVGRVKYIVRGKIGDAGERFFLTKNNVPADLRSLLFERT